MANEEGKTGWDVIKGALKKPKNGFWRSFAPYLVLVSSPFGILAALTSIFPNTSLALRIILAAGLFMLFLYLYVSILLIRISKETASQLVKAQTDLSEIINTYESQIESVKQEKERAMAELEKKYESYKGICDLSGKFYGLSRKKFLIHAVLKEDGSMLTVGETEFITTMNDVAGIAHYKNVPHLPEETQGKIGVKITSKFAGKMKVEPQIRVQRKDYIFWSLNFRPPLKKGEVVNYTYEERILPGSFVNTYEKLRQRGMEREHYSMRISYPTEFFRIKVLFDVPPELEPEECNFDVWFGTAQVKHLEEIKRIQEKKHFFWDYEKGKLYCQLEIPYPIHGLYYALKWKPRELGQRQKNYSL